MIARILVALGFPIAAVGLTIYGMGTSMAVPDSDMMDLGMIMMVGGVIAGIIGIFWYRADEKKHEA
ncbi:MAG: hypothetical protein R2845_13450 [Thermomicrobiales bacterium]